MSCGFSAFSDTRPSPGVRGGSLDLAMLEDRRVRSSSTKESYIKCLLLICIYLGFRIKAVVVICICLSFHIKAVSVICISYRVSLGFRPFRESDATVWWIVNKSVIKLRFVLLSVPLTVTIWCP